LNRRNIYETFAAHVKSLCETLVQFVKHLCRSASIVSKYHGCTAFLFRYFFETWKRIRTTRILSHDELCQGGYFYVICGQK